MGASGAQISRVHACVGRATVVMLFVAGMVIAPTARAEHALDVVKLKIKTGTDVSPKGKVSAKGDFVLDTGEEFLGTSHIALRVVDGLDIDVQAPAATPGSPDGAFCDTTVPARIRCKGKVPLVSAVFKFGPPSASGARLVSWTVKIAKLATSPIPFAPVTLTITDVAQPLDFVGVISDCFPRNGKLTCKEF